MNLVLFDNKHRSGLLPFTFTRPQATVRCGILTIEEKWSRWLNVSASCLSNGAIGNKYEAILEDDNIYIAASVIPSEDLVHAVERLNLNCGLQKCGEVIAIRADDSAGNLLLEGDYSNFRLDEYGDEIKSITKVYHLITLNQSEINADFALITKGRQTKEISETNMVVGVHKDPSLVKKIFIEDGAEVEYAYLNPKGGPIYIGKNTTVMEGSMLRGPIAICDHAQISMGAKIYPGATIGPWSKIGGEVSNSIITGYSNKVHDGFLGDSIIGEWCNLGADTNTSNLKNDYAKVKLWDYAEERFVNTGLQFCGLVMGDYARCAINTSFNSGTVVGTGSNIFGSGFPRNFVPSFVIGGPQGYKINGLKAVQRTSKLAMGRRNVVQSEEDLLIFDEVFEATKKYRSSLK